MTSNNPDIRNNWTIDEVAQLFAMPFNDLLLQAQTLHRTCFQPNQLQACILLSIKTGACPEDCKYCAQSGHYNTQLTKEKLIQVEKVVEAARKAKESGATRFCMGAAWRNPPARDMPMLVEMIQQVKALELETCMTLGMLSRQQADTLAEAGLDYYNHNLDTSPEHYGNIITTRTYTDRLETLAHVRDSGMKVCCGGILGLGETLHDRASLLQQLANLPAHPESVPVNRLSKIPGTPMENAEEVSGIEFVKTIAAARIMMPKTYIRLAAGRESMSDELQALAYMAGANSIFRGEKLLTTPNVGHGRDTALFSALGITLETYEETINHGGGNYGGKAGSEITPPPLFYEAMPLAGNTRV